MILKILARHSPSYKSLINYILQEGKSKEGNKPEVITHNLRSKDIEGYVKEFIQNESFRNHPRSNQIYLYHEIISFGKADRENITKEKLTDIAREYIQQRGTKGMYIGAIHEDKEHFHIHLASSGVEFRTGKAFRLSHTDLKELKINLQNYHQQKYPEISRSYCEHGTNKPYLTNKEYQARQRDERALYKAEMQNTVNECFRNAGNQQQFLEMLQNENLHHYERNGQPQGVMYEDMKFRFSRLNIDFKQLPQLPTDMKKEQQILDEIYALRESRNEKTKDKPAPVISIEEAYGDYKAEELKKVRELLDEVYAQKDALFIEIQKSETGIIPEDRGHELDAIIHREAELLSQAQELSFSLEADKYQIVEPKELEEKQDDVKTDKEEKSTEPEKENYLSPEEMTEFALQLEEEHQALIEAEEVEQDSENKLSEDIEPDIDELEVIDEIQEIREEIDRDRKEIDEDIEL